MNKIEMPKKRSNLRLMFGKLYYGTKRKIKWIAMNPHFAKTIQPEKLPYRYFAHKTVILRKLKDVDMWLQKNKIINLKIASKKLNGIVLRPGEVFSYWRLIGSTTRRKGYVEGMVLKNGSYTHGVGGGLCQMSNLIFWMTLHTPLTVIERHRHGYDVFPDSNRTQPFGSGATCFYPHIDLMIRNDTEDTYQLVVEVKEKYLEGEWRVSSQPMYRYEVVERNHRMQHEIWGGYSRHNEIYKQKYDIEGNLITEEMIVQNSAIMMYTPFLEANNQSQGEYHEKTTEQT